MIIKDFNDFDTNELYAIFRHIYITSPFMSDNFDRKFNSIIDFRNYYHQILRQNGSFVMVTLVDKRPAGFLVLASNPAEKLNHTAWLNMGILESFRRKGIGVQLVESAIERARKENLIEIIYLMVRADHTGAVQLYRKTGFEVIARLEKNTKIGNDYYDGLLMRKFVHI